ncbi:uncharacterized protein LOC114516082 [Dendronephthya gigantea]|uniref:uncharacterized protein LOC114516082 n=1 Tax=Dendronephthya gigantea TaxID=151771 RepID=UPI00106B0A13|nr:uncharacterized protein LOC114516082 [Dendronephthya gigantea]
MANDAPFVSRPTLTDIDPELLRNIFAQETRYFQQNCTAVDSSASRPCTSPEEEGDSLLIKVANCLLRHGDGIKKVHSCFKQLTPRQYLVHVKPCQMEPDNFTVVTDDYRRPYSGSETPEVTNKESGSQLHPQELEIYECALFAAQYPVLANPDDSLDITVRSTRRPSEVSDLSGERC